MTTTTDAITLGGGCLRCTEAVFDQIRGVVGVETGDCDGEVRNTTYEHVCTGRTGHVEAIRVTFDQSSILGDHQHDDARHPDKGHGAMVVAPKIAKFRQTFADRVRSDAVA